MTAKPRTAAGYAPGFVEHVRATCLYISTKLGDLLDDVVVVGGLVPSLLVSQTAPQELHIGTLDLDIGLSLAIFDAQRYQELSERLRGAGFSPDTNERGNPTRQRWRHDGPPKVTVDFLIPPTEPSDKGGVLKNIEPDFAAIIAPGLRVAFLDREKITLDGLTLLGERACRDVWVCGPGAYVVMKALAFRSRGENKDAYDLQYLVRNYGTGVEDVGSRLIPLLEDVDAAAAIRCLRKDFETVDSLGPRRAAEFIHGELQRNEEAEADVWSAVRDLLDQLPETPD